MPSRDESVKERVTEGPGNITHSKNAVLRTETNYPRRYWHQLRKTTGTKSVVTNQLEQTKDRNDAALQKTY